ncbi:hypothetical protein NUU61_008539 [Penicillium alfredii]|uniref:Methyltransferase type 11 domain-containing protein n=1 Tax=Penicillium alfredii TaxID=1506179 RepID=A0A9W9ELK8_9EURO|nr:uncharacterized protein NUU61_008539 [Penicillium alfredii]KAJ5083960.1 hypothetical protein NUU61_008539 [Penicillium alfredii]
MPPQNPGRRMPSKDSLSQPADASHSGIAYVSRYQRSPIARPLNHTPRSSRASSLSDAEGTGHAPGVTAKQTTARTNRQSMLPRPSTGGSTSAASPVASTPPQHPLQCNPVSFSTPEVNNPSAFVAASQTPAKRPRNVLRRKAPTIGRHAEQTQSQSLSLVIPPAPQSNVTNDLEIPTFPEPPQSGSSTLSYGTGVKAEPNSVENAKSQGPAELASLRTTIDTQNLPPPPTPFFPSASTPSTRYSESPGIWSRGSTPTSLSSYSPGIVHSAKVGRLRQPSPSQTRLPVFSPALHASPQSDRAEPRKHQRATSGKSSGSSTVASAGEQRQANPKTSSTIPRGPPCSPPPRKSSINFSPLRKLEIDVEKARKEVEEAERSFYESQRVITALPDTTSPRTPPRPSRDGTHRLEQQTSPVVQSNLPYLKSTGHTRRESAERLSTTDHSHPAPNQSAAASTDSLRSKQVSRIPPREARSPVASRKSPRTLIKEKPDPKKQTTPKRFGLFPKKSKPDMDNSSADHARPARKGPAAGTGHEGYGKYSQRGRKTSASSSSGTRTRSTSTTARSVSSSKGSMSSRPELDIDEFLMSRLEPVIINGGGLDGTTLSRTQSEQSASSISVASTTNLPRPPLFASSTGQSTDSLATSTGTLGETDTPSDSGTSFGPTRSKSPERKPPAAARSQQKSRMPVPKSKKHGIFANLEAATTRTSLSKRDSKSVASSQPKTAIKPSFERLEQPTEQKEYHQEKKGKSSRWNFFQRNRVANEQKQKNSAPAAPAFQTAQLHAAISPVINSRPIAHYALVDTDTDSLDDIINKVEQSPPTEDEESPAPVEVPAGLNIRKRHESVLLPSLPKLQGEFETNERPSPKTALFNTNLMGAEPEKCPENTRPRRLASVGRIPQVVSRRDRQHRPAMHSFSRPFSVAESPSLLAAVMDGSYESSQPNKTSSNTHTDWRYGINQAFSALEQVSALDFLAGPYSNNEFLHFSPNKGSPSSSSSGALAAVTAVIPEPGAAPMEDEVWNEYNDLLDHVLSPEEPEAETKDSGKQVDDRFEMATMASRALQDELDNIGPLRKMSTTPTRASARSSDSSVRLRRSRIISALHSSIDPSPQPSYSDLIAGYGDSREDGLATTTNTEHPPSTDQLNQQQSTFLHSLATVPPPKRENSGGKKPLASSSERDWDAVTRTNMRSASLMTSRWLSFGRVLFSPAHNHVKAGTQGRILVVDGLGNDDWSFYCSLTYPDAEVYSLGGRPASSVLPHPAAWQPPTNHHTFYHTGLEKPLPFPKDYFTVAVLRFPAACSEMAQSNIVQECKRVLRSGGYLEMSLLDRDMVNMGARSRKAVRRLKEMTCLADSRISLKPTSDSIQRLIGGHGFDNLRRCMVRIPVAGMVVRSSDSTTSSSSRSLTATTTPNPNAPSTAFSLPTISVTSACASHSSKSPSDDPNVSLGDLLSDPSPSPANDESIAKIVARVGRWWYTKCHEDPVLPHRSADADSSMWNDRKLLRECQKRGTGFRMLIAYAQKPSEVKRRTASV